MVLLSATVLFLFGLFLLGVSVVLMFFSIGILGSVMDRGISWMHIFINEFLFNTENDFDLLSDNIKKPKKTRTKKGTIKKEKPVTKSVPVKRSEKLVKRAGKRVKTVNSDNTTEVAVISDIKPEEKMESESD